MKDIKYFLVDNGSLNPNSIFNLRNVAKALGERVGLSIRPVGLMHSHKIDPVRLNNEAAETFESLLLSEESKGWQGLVVIPMFFGPSLAVTDWLPKKLDAWQKEEAKRSFVILPCLYQHGDTRIAQALVSNTLKSITKSGMNQPFVALVDHGTPLRAVNQIREEIGSQLEELLKPEISGFSTCSMERREGEKYDFNDPLLAPLLDELSKKGEKEVVLAQLFLSPGRHAGKGGDLEEICSSFQGRLTRTELLGTHPAIIEILEDRILSFSKELL